MLWFGFFLYFLCLHTDCHSVLICIVVTSCHFFPVVILVAVITIAASSLAWLLLNDIKVRQIVDFRDNVMLCCRNDMSGHTLNSAKWYKRTERKCNRSGELRQQKSSNVVLLLLSISIASYAGNINFIYK